MRFTFVTPVQIGVNTVSSVSDTDFIIKPVMNGMWLLITPKNLREGQTYWETTVPITNCKEGNEKKVYYNPQSVQQQLQRQALNNPQADRTSDLLLRGGNMAFRDASGNIIQVTETAQAVVQQQVLAEAEAIGRGEIPVEVAPKKKNSYKKKVTNV